MTPPEIAWHRLLNQRLVAGSFNAPEDVVQWLGAVQAQDYAGAKWALGMRVPRSVDADVERAFTAGTILRTHLLRPTWHFVSPADIRWMLALTAPRVDAANAYMYRKLGLDSATFARSNAAIAKALHGTRHVTRDELRNVLQRAGVSTDGQLRMAYLMMRAELDALVCSGPRRGAQFTYALLDERAPATKAVDRQDALVALTRRFFLSRGPATPHDFAKWSGLTMADARRGLEGSSHQLEQEIVDGKTYWFAPARGLAVERPVAHLLSIYDEYVSGYRDRSAIVRAQHGKRLVAMGNALTGIVLIDGRVVGTWKRTLSKGAIAVKVECSGRTAAAESRAIDAAVRSYCRFFGSAEIDAGHRHEP